MLSLVSNPVASRSSKASVEPALFVPHLGPASFPVLLVFTWEQPEAEGRRASLEGIGKPADLVLRVNPSLSVRVGVKGGVRSTLA